MILIEFVIVLFYFSAMFGFMKKHSDKDREEKDKRKREKKETKKSLNRKAEKPLTKEELQRLDEARKGLYKTNGSHFEGGAVSYSDSSESLGSSQHGTRETTPDSSGATFTSSASMHLGKANRIPPPVQPKPKKGILKDKSTYGPEIPNQGVRGNPSDVVVTEENTLVNEMMSGKHNNSSATSKAADQPPTITHPDLKHKMVRSISGSSDSSTTSGAPSLPRSGPPKKPVVLSKPKPLHPKPDVMITPPRRAPPQIIEPPSGFREDDASLDEQVPLGPPSPDEKIYANVDLQLPRVAPPRSLRPRMITLKRLPAGDFGFSLRKGTVLERGVSDNVERKRKVIFAEPGVKNLTSGLLPGDRLLEVDGKNVEDMSREELIEIIRRRASKSSSKCSPYRN